MTKSIFIADDDTLMIDIYTKVFAEDGFQVFGAQDGEQAKNMLVSENLNPDVFLFDVMMPKMTGFELFEFVKSQDKYKDTPIVFLTNLYDPKDVEKAKTMGADLYLVKSDSDPKEVVEKINGLIAKK